MTTPKKERSAILAVRLDPPRPLKWSEANTIAIKALFALLREHGEGNYRILCRAILRQLK